jgi:hypothetical protein
MRCGYKHKLFRWRGINGSYATVLGDSLCKWVRQIKYCDVQSIPGLNIQRAIERIKDRTLFVAHYRLIIVCIGTNDSQKYEPSEICHMMTDLIDTIRHINPTARVAISSILFRPCDIPAQMEVIRMRPHLTRKYPSRETSLHTQPPPPQPFTPSTQPLYLQPEKPSASAVSTPPTPPPAQDRPKNNQEIYDALEPIEKRRRITNKGLHKLCKEENLFFMRAWRCMQNDDKTVNLALFGDDGLHLGEDGIDALKIYLEGSVVCLLDRKKRHRRKKTKAIITDMATKKA